MVPVLHAGTPQDSQVCKGGPPAPRPHAPWSGPHACHGPPNPPRHRARRAARARRVLYIYVSSMYAGGVELRASSHCVDGSTLRVFSKALHHYLTQVQKYNYSSCNVFHKSTFGFAGLHLCAGSERGSAYAQSSSATGGHPVGCRTI